MAAVRTSSSTPAALRLLVGAGRVMHLVSAGDVAAMWFDVWAAALVTGGRGNMGDVAARLVVAGFGVVWR